MLRDKTRQFRRFHDIWPGNGAPEPPWGRSSIPTQSYHRLQRDQAFPAENFISHIQFCYDSKRRW